MDAEEERVGNGNGAGSAAAAVQGGNTWDFEEDHLLSYFLGGAGSVASEPSINNDNAGTNAADGGANAAAGTLSAPEAASSAADVLAAASAQAAQQAQAQSQAQAALASNYASAMAANGNSTDMSPSMGSVSFHFPPSPLTGSLMANNNTNVPPGPPSIPPSSPGSTTTGNKARKCPSSSSLRKSSSCSSTSSGSSSRRKMGFVIGADEAPPPGRVTFADLGEEEEEPVKFGDDGDDEGQVNIPKFGGSGRKFGVEPPATPSQQFYGSASTSNSTSNARRVPSSTQLSTHGSSSSSSSSDSLGALGRAMAMSSVDHPQYPSSSSQSQGDGSNSSRAQAVMQVHKTLQMKAEQLPTPPTPQMMMMLGNSQAMMAAASAAAAAASTSTSAGASASSAQAMAGMRVPPPPPGSAGSMPMARAPGYSPLSPAGALGSPEHMMLPPPMQWPVGPRTGGGAGPPNHPGGPFPPAPAPVMSMNMTPQQQQAYFLQHQQFLQQLNYNAQIFTQSANPNRQQKQAQQVQSQSPSPIKSQKKDLPPMPEVSSEDIVKAAAAAGIINPALGHGRPGRGGVMPEPVGSGGVGPGGKGVESEEKRQQRLARNRESARKSRRQKKERLELLAAQKGRLQDRLEVERRRCIAAMEGGLRQNRAEGIAVGLGDEKQSLAQTLEFLVRESGPKCPARSATANFQHTTLQTQMLPNYREFLLWLSTQPPSFLYAGKEEWAKDPTAKKTTSSKQIGEELFGGGKGKGKTSVDEVDLSATTDDPRRFWPMLCYDMSISVDQEERIAAGQNNMYHSSTLPAGRQEVATAKSMVRSLKHGILYQGHSSAHRSEVALLDILTPEQSARYLQWTAANKDRCDRILRNKVGGRAVAAAEEGPMNLDMLSQRLKAALHFGET